MNKKVILVSVVVLLSTAGLLQAQEGELHGTIDLTFQSKYIWRGFDVYGDKSAIQPSIDLDLYGTGFGATIMGHRANSDKYENDERWDYTLYYHNSIFDDEHYTTNYTAGWTYYNFPDGPTRGFADSDMQEFFLALAWPKIFPAGIVPSYTTVYMWQDEGGNSSFRKCEGMAHIFGLDYGLTVPGLLPETPEQVLNLHAEAVYNDGVGPGGSAVDHDWSNAVFGVSTDFDLGNNLTFTPGLYHQVTMDKSVNPDKDETWVSLGLRYKF